MTFDPAAVETFRFREYDFDPRSARARLVYSFDDTHEFVEELTFAGADLPLSPEREAALDRCLRHLHLVAGVSYYKAAVPERIVVETGPLSLETALFLDTLYLHGLGEFAYRNELDLRGRIRFPGVPQPVDLPPPLALRRRTAVAMGGGKDSLVTLDALRKAGEEIALITVGDYAPVRAVAERAGLPLTVIQRRIAPVLLELNAQGALNGHVPISAILAFVLAAAAVLYRFDAVALSNERSADAPNLTIGGWQVNHQYSKSAAFERDAGRILETVLPGFRYFSLLRPFSELAIGALFSELESYRDVFRSCNRAFRQRSEQRAGGWCLDCAKCRFVFLILAPFVPRDELIAVLRGNPLDDEQQIPGYAALFGLTEHLPFDCVGEVEESLAALAWLARAPEWKGEVVVRHFSDRLADRLDGAAELLERALAPSGPESVPESFRPAVGALSARLAVLREGLLSSLVAV